MATKSVLTNVQICRGFAAMMVVIGHSLQDYDFFAVRAGLAPSPVGVNWGCGVNIFFVISGFIMVHVSARDFGVPGAPGQFMLKRILRIVPSYWLVTTALILGSLVAPGLLNVPIGGAQHILASYLFIPDWRPDMSIVRPVMALGWTLNYEMLFYVMFAATMVLPFERGIAALVGVFSLGVLARFVFDIHQTQIAFWLDPIVFNFLFGVFIGIAYRAGWRLSGPVALALGAAGLFLVAKAAPQTAPGAFDLGFLRYGLPAALLVAATALGPNVSDSPLTRLGVLVGDASYALYLIHPFIVRPMREVWLKIGGSALSASAYCLVCCLGATLAAIAMYRFFEAPLGRALRSVGRAAPHDHAHPIQTALPKLQDKR